MNKPNQPNQPEYKDKPMPDIQDEKNNTQSKDKNKSSVAKDEGCC